MTRIDIIKKQSEILECAKTFRYYANLLMRELSKDFDFNIESAELLPIEMYSHKYNSKGVFRGDWTYYFHGAECRFDNLRSGQVVEVIITTRPEFGFLDGYFFYNYMLTTDKFKSLATWFTGYVNVWKALDILEEEGILTKVASVQTARNIIAL